MEDDPKIDRQPAPRVIVHLHVSAGTLMNIRLSEVLADITGVTGQAIVRAMVAGERDPAILAPLRTAGCKHTEAEITKALTGTWQDAQICILTHNLQRYDFYTAQLIACASAMERSYQTMGSRGEPNAPLPDLPPAKPGSNRSTSRPSMCERSWRAASGSIWSA